MCTILGSSGGVSRLFLRAAIFSLLILAGFSLTTQQTANAQIWVSSGFKPSSDGTQEIGYCITTAINPATGQASPAAADYSASASACKVIPSTGAAITSSQCPYASPFHNPAGPATANPTGECDVVFTPQSGVTYTVNSAHAIWFILDPVGTVCGGFNGTPCFSDPLGYYAFNLTTLWPPPNTFPPIIPTKNASGLSVYTPIEETCDKRSGTCNAQGVPYEFCASSVFGICSNGYIQQRMWNLANTSAIWQMQCADVVNNAVTVINPPLFPSSYDEGCGISASFAPNFGLTIGEAAQVCGFTNFNWQQYITSLPLPSPIKAAHSSVPLYTPPAFLDPPPGGYEYELTARDQATGELIYPAGDNAYPYYYNPKLNPGEAGQPELEDHELGGTDGAELTFFDEPQDPCLFGGAGVGTTLCNGSGAGAPETLQFRTNLVGIKPDGSPHDLGVGFNWDSSCNNTTGGTGATKNALPSDPGGGTGHSTVTFVSETTQYQYPKPAGVQNSALTFLGNQISTTGSGLVYSRVSKLFIGTLTITNDSQYTINGPFQIVLESLTTGVSLSNATGNFGGWPYISIPSIVSLDPGQSATVSVRFSNPAMGFINTAPMVYSGSFE